MFLSRRELKNFDWYISLLVLALLSVGLAFVFSATYKPGGGLSYFFKKQVIGVFLSILIYIFASVKESRNRFRILPATYFVVIVLLFYTVMKGMVVMGAQRWISLYFFRFQPSELVKILMPPLLALILIGEERYKIKEKRVKWKQTFLAFAVIAITAILTLKQPDLGTAVIITISGLATAWIAGIDNKIIVSLFLLLLAASPIIWKKMKPYQKKRIMVLLGKGSRDDKYQIEQSRISIGSGGLYGKGFLRGTQNKLLFLPEDHTDFIFSVLCEEIGFLGALTVIILFLLLFLRIVSISLKIREAFYKVVVIGLAIPIMLSFVVNIGMAVGIFPTVGIPMPLFSYGITHIWVTMATLGWINNIKIRFASRQL